MKKTNIIASIGIIIYIIISFVDRFIIKLADSTYIGIVIGVIVCLMIGILNRKNYKKEQ